MPIRAGGLKYASQLALMRLIIERYEIVLEAPDR